ncbi:MAG: hypothetical protein FWE03_04650 [Firmicutes bacterium]|nr:hypothetical protein [Bacillota bacterium]
MKIQKKNLIISSIIVVVFMTVLNLTACNFLAYSWGEWEITTAAGCTEYGQKTRICKNLPTRIQTESISPTGHSWGEWTMAKYPCTAHGIKIRSCLNLDCSKEEEKFIDAVYALESQKIRAGDASSFAIDKNGNLWGWGRNNNGQLGDGSNINRHSPIQINTNGRMYDSKIEFIAAGRNHSLAIDINGRLWAWGSTESGRLGDGTDGFIGDFINTPVLINHYGWDNLRIVYAATGYSHSLALDENGNLWSWGHGFRGQLGHGMHGPHVRSAVPVLINTDGRMNNSKIEIISSGDLHSLAIDEYGNLWAWGSNQAGQLGDGMGGMGNFSNSDTPILVNTNGRMNDAKVREISAGGGHSLAIDEHGYLWAWGSNGVGQLGSEQENTAFVPILANTNGRMYNNAKAISISAGGSHSLVIDEHGYLWAFGGNWDGQLGDGTGGYQEWWENYSYVPILVNVSGRINNAFIIYFSAGQQHSFAIDSKGNLWAWGLNTLGVLGDGTVVSQNTPKNIFWCVC